MNLEERVAALEEGIDIQNEKNGELVSMIDQLELRVRKLEPPATGGRRNRSLRTRRSTRHNRSRKH